jgi:hypothetical protein
MSDSDSSSARSVADLPSLLPVERTWLSQCTTARVSGAILPSITLGFVLYRFLPLPPAGKAIVGLAGGSFILGTSVMMAPTMCGRDFATSTDFPTAAAIRSQIRQRTPQHYIVRNFDQAHPNLDATLRQQGQTKLGRIPYELQLPDSLYKELFENESDPTEQAKAASSQAKTSATTAVQQSYQMKEDLSAQISSLPSSLSAPAPSEFIADPAEVLADPSEIAASSRPRQPPSRPARGGLSGHEFFSDLTPGSSSSSSEPAIQRAQAKLDKATRRAQATLERERQQRDELFASPQQPRVSSGPRLKVKRNQYGDEVFEEEAFSDRQD